MDMVIGQIVCRKEARIVVHNYPMEYSWHATRTIPNLLQGNTMKETHPPSTYENPVRAEDKCVYIVLILLKVRTYELDL